MAKITVYSNLPEVELFANGKSMGKKTAGDHFFRFEVPNCGETKLTAVADECKDESTIRKVEEPNPAYRLVEKGAVLNWWDITEKEGCCSLNTRMKVLVTAVGIDSATELVKPLIGEGTKPELLEMMANLTVLKFVVGLAGIFGREVTKEALLELNEKLNTIRVKAV